MPSRTPALSPPAYIYLIRDEFTGLYKIGRSKDPERRLKDLRQELTKLPIQFNFHLLGVWLTSEPVGIEGFIHDVFDDQRVRGEWFDLEGPGIDCHGDPHGPVGKEAIKNFFEFMTVIPDVEPTFKPGWREAARARWGGQQCR